MYYIIYYILYIKYYILYIILYIINNNNNILHIYIIIYITYIIYNRWVDLGLDSLDEKNSDSIM